MTGERVGWRKAIAGMLLAGLTVCLLGAALAPLLKPEMPARMDALAVTAPVATPLPSLEPAEVEIVRTTESIYASQPGDSIPISYSTPRIMQAGTVLVELTSVRIRGEEVTQGTQRLRFQLIDALTGAVLGTADVTRTDGVDDAPAVLATLTEPKATYLTVSAEVRGESTCDGCEYGSYRYDMPIWHRWSALLQYDAAG
ncbi:hypothetical protein [Gordonia rubripertincta]|uniref:hypothetical protein n=1 Tax=Gordonia rubripertincta TaxID=36822 RepID=UPI000B8D72EE|nr:hypothetical protein [Gordonia rubripertincta]ASR05643.1 hypothetical protein GCWB2_24360 [Gordonia rubripertincta]